MAGLLVCSNGYFHWNVSFFKVAHDGELGMFVEFFDSLYAMSFGNVMEEDRMIWISVRSNRFLVRSYYKVLSGFSTDHCFPWEGLKLGSARFLLRLPSLYGMLLLIDCSPLII